MAPSDYHLFPNPKKDLRKKSYSSGHDVEKNDSRVVEEMPSSFYEEDIAKLKHRWEMCLKVKGHYVEK